MIAYATLLASTPWVEQVAEFGAALRQSQPLQPTVDTRDWLTYHTNELSISFRYPAGWSIVTSTSAFDNAKAVFLVSQLRLQRYAEFGAADITINVEASAYRSFAEFYAESEWPRSDMQQFSRAFSVWTNVNGVELHVVRGLPGNVSSDVAFLISDGGVIWISKDSVRHDEVFASLLSSIARTRNELP